MIQMRWSVLLVVVVASCQEPIYQPPRYTAPTQPAIDVPSPTTAADTVSLGTLDDRLVDWVFDGGQIEFEMYRRGSRLVQIARNRFAVPVVLRWQLGAFENVDARSPTDGVAVLPAAPTPFGIGQNVILAELEVVRPNMRYRRDLYFQARWGDPRVRPTDYVYRLPWAQGQTFSVLQGWHGQFSHRGSNEYAVDFDCPVATTVLAARPGVIVAANASAQGSGVTPEWNDYKKTNFVLVQHDDGTLGEYMHLSPSSIEVKPGQRVERGQPLALSGNTGFSSTPHLHFAVMTAGDDGQSGRSFPFRFAVSPRGVEEPLQGRRYLSWEQVPTLSR
jgi:murein DD-endopeptidase MepM/ murein hydrolase activator NlpD